MKKADKGCNLITKKQETELWPVQIKSVSGPPNEKKKKKKKTTS